MASLHKKTAHQEPRTLQDLESCSHLHLAVETQDGPYCVPIQHLLLGSTIYFCCNRSDELCDLLTGGPRVCISGVMKTQAQETGFLPVLQGVHAFGVTEQVDGAEETRQALFGLYYRHASPDNKQEAWIFSRNEVWCVYKVKIERVGGN